VGLYTLDRRTEGKRVDDWKKKKALFQKSQVVIWMGSPWEKFLTAHLVIRDIGEGEKASFQIKANQELRDKRKEQF